MHFRAAGVLGERLVGSCMVDVGCRGRRRVGRESRKKGAAGPGREA